MTILTATEDGAVDDTACDIDFSLLNIGPCIEVRSLIALTCTKEIAGHGVIGNLSQGTWYTDRTSRHGDGTLAFHVGYLVTAIDAGQDMTAGDVHHGLTLYQTGRAQPVVFLGAAVSSLERIVAGTATEYITVVGVSVGAFSCIVITVALT